jgi:hypothetical protein
MMFGNIGLIYRQRAQLLPWLLILAAVGLERRVVSRRGATVPPHPSATFLTAPIPQKGGRAQDEDRG